LRPWQRTINVGVWERPSQSVIVLSAARLKPTVDEPSIGESGRAMGCHLDEGTVGGAGAVAGRVAVGSVGVVRVAVALEEGLAHRETAVQNPISSVKSRMPPKHPTR
jgi:hypothetical protein